MPHNRPQAAEKMHIKSQWVLAVFQQHARDGGRVRVGTGQGLDARLQEEATGIGSATSRPLRRLGSQSDPLTTDSAHSRCGQTKDELTPGL